MKRISISVTASDNGCIAFYGPLIAQSQAAKVNNNTKSCFYVSRTLDPKDVGETLLAMLTDLAMTEAQFNTTPITDLEID